MAALAGYQGLLKIGTFTIAQVQEIDLDIENIMEDVSVMGIRGEQFLPTMFKSTLKAKVFYDMTDTNGQLAVQNAAIANPPTLLTMSFSPLNGATNTTFSFSAYVAKLSLKNAVEKAVTEDLDFQPTGNVTIA